MSVRESVRDLENAEHTWGELVADGLLDFGGLRPDELEGGEGDGRLLTGGAPLFEFLKFFFLIFLNCCFNAIFDDLRLAIVDDFLCYTF